MTKPPNVATIRDNIAGWRGLDGRRYYRPILEGLKLSRHVFTTKTEAIEHRKRVLNRYESLKKAKRKKPKGKVWLT